MVKSELLSEKELIDATQLKKMGLAFTANALMQVLKLDKLNGLYQKNSNQKGLSFIDAALEDIGISYHVHDNDLANLPKEGAFVAVSNHPYGMIDGLILLRVIGGERVDFKAVVNFLLNRIKPIQDYFIGVGPFENEPGKDIDLLGMKAALAHLQAGHALGIFPAGEISNHQGEFKNNKDENWQHLVMKIIHKGQVPVVPVYFEEANSQTYHLLNKQHPVLKTATIPSEMYHKQNIDIKIRIGKIIPIEQQKKFETVEKLGEFLRARVHAHGSAVAWQRSLSAQDYLQKADKVIGKTNDKLLIEEINYLRRQNVLIEKDRFKIFQTTYDESPNILREISRLRELTFRKIGEGTLKSNDTDIFDRYYDHLILWDDKQLKIAGSYRVGRGKELMKKYGEWGFYTSSIFTYAKEFFPILETSIELGRSFIIGAYQKQTFPLFLLWKGIEQFLSNNHGYKYLLGSVSISNYYSDVSKNFMVNFIKKYHFNENLAKQVKAKNEFKTNDSNSAFDVLIEQCNDIKKLDTLIADIEPNGYKVPILLKKYISQHAQIIGFNVDRDFNNSLDGLMILDLKNLPENSTYKNALPNSQ